MKGERKLRLVVVGKDAAASEEPPITDDERAAAALLREALDGDSDPLALALRAAHVSGSLDATDLDALVERALGDESAATRAERDAAERLRADLEGPGIEGEADLLRALKAAALPAVLPADRHEALLDAALARRSPFALPPRAAGEGSAPKPRAEGSAPVRRIPPAVMVALTGVAALAAGVALFLGRAGEVPSAAPPVALVPARSSEGMFDAATPFPRRGEESARIDRIAAARVADLRHNRFATWGVK